MSFSNALETAIVGLSYPRDTSLSQVSRDTQHCIFFWFLGVSWGIYPNGIYLGYKISFLYRWDPLRSSGISLGSYGIYLGICLGSFWDIALCVSTCFFIYSKFEQFRKII